MLLEEYSGNISSSANLNSDDPLKKSTSNSLVINTAASCLLILFIGLKVPSSYPATSFSAAA